VSRRLVRSTPLRRFVGGLLCAAILLQPVLGSSVALAKTKESATAESAPTATPFDDGTNIDPGVSTPLLTDAPGATPVDLPPWTAAIDKLLAGEDGVYGIVLMKPDGTVLYRHNSELPFVAASLYKLILLADICHAVEAGALSLDTPLYVDPGFYDPEDGIDSYFDESYAGYDTTIEEALLATGAYSSNVAAKALLTLTSADVLYQTIADLGLTGTYLNVDPTGLSSWPPSTSDDIDKHDAKLTRKFVQDYAYDGEVNLTTPMDMARYFQLLLEGKLIDKHVSKMIQRILSQQMIDNRFPALLPSGTRLIHKTGNLDFVVHDVGVIYGKSGPIILSAMAQGPSNEERATQVEQRLALIAYGDYDVPPVVITPETTPPASDGTSIDLPPATPISEA
jgi:beta-lactamase class A